MPRCGPWNFSVAISWIGICWATFYTRFESSIWDNGNALQHHIASTQSKIEELANYTRYRKPAKSDHCLVLSVTESVSQSLLLLNFVQIGFVKVIRWICQNWYMIFSDFLHVFVIIDTSYMDFSKMLHGSVQVAKWICQSCSIYFFPFAKQNQAEVWPRFKSLLKLLLWTKCAEWVKILNSLGSLCLS